MQEVQTRRRLVAPFTTARTVCRLRFQRRLVTLWAWLMRWPNCGPRPHTSHTLAIPGEISCKSLKFDSSRELCGYANRWTSIFTSLFWVFGMGRTIHIPLAYGKAHAEYVDRNTE